MTYGNQTAYNMIKDVLGEGAYDVIDYEKKSFDYIIDMIERYVKTHPEIEYVYRPHPSELANKQLDFIIEKYSNFHVISDLNIKQWIKVADQVNTWNSTAISEVFYGKKPCLVVDIPREQLTLPAKNYRIRIINESKIVSTYKAFEEWNDKNQIFIEEEFPIDKEIFDDYYGYTDREIPVYKKLCDELEKIVNENKYIQLFRCDSSLRERTNELRKFWVTLRGNIRFFTFPIINSFLPSKCIIDKYLAQHEPKRLREIYNGIKEWVNKE